ncbi:MAG: hypothetical protein LBV41_13245 [Cytophagaceae bacterium]|jgi:hypothetical protein|nr:hypothetical protein [Cytophagaceae bacterium]
MKKLIFAATGVILCAAMFTGYKGYRNATMTAQERLLMTNVEALTRGETEGVEIVDVGTRTVYDDKGNSYTEQWCDCHGIGSLDCPC